MLNKLLKYRYSDHIFQSVTNLYYSKYSAAGLVLQQNHNQAIYNNPKIKLTTVIYANQDLQLFDRLKNLELHILQGLLLCL